VACTQLDRAGLPRGLNCHDRRSDDEPAN
jgi:hypothetical protein